jgi:hypothetical protein
LVKKKKGRLTTKERASERRFKPDLLFKFAITQRLVFGALSSSKKKLVRAIDYHN